MVHGMAISVASFFVRKQYISDKLYDWCVYAVERRIQKLLVLGLILAVAFFTDTVVESFIFYVGFISFRKRMGGYHAATPIACGIESILLVQAGVWLLQPALESYARSLGVCFGTVSYTHLIGCEKSSAILTDYRTFRTRQAPKTPAKTDVV